MSFRNQLKSVLPPSLWMFAGFCKRLPAYWRLDRSDSLRVKNGDEGLILYITPETLVEIPENLSAFINWHTHALTDPSSAQELQDFIELAKGKTAFIDIGAQTGFISAVFSRIAKAPAMMASLEPDPQVHEILEEARDRNRVAGIDWQIIHSAVSNISGKLLMPVSNTVLDKRSPKIAFGEMIPVSATTLDDLVISLGWEPDIIKIDVESYEYEILNSSWGLIERLRPAIQLEIHWQLLKSRNLDGLEIMKRLHELDYRGPARKSFGFRQWKKLSENETVSRFSLQKR